MCTVKLSELMDGKSLVDAGALLFDQMMICRNSDKIVIDMDGVSSLPSIFLNVSFGYYIDRFGKDSLKGFIKFVNINKPQVARIIEYVDKYENLQLVAADSVRQKDSVGGDAPAESDEKERERKLQLLAKAKILIEKAKQAQAARKRQ